MLVGMEGSVCILFALFKIHLYCCLLGFFFENCIFSINTEKKKSRKHYVRNPRDDMTLNVKEQTGIFPGVALP